MASKDKGKKKLVQPKQFKTGSSSMSISSEPDTEILVQPSVNIQSSSQTERIHSQQQVQGLDDIDRYIQSQYTTLNNTLCHNMGGPRPRFVQNRPRSPHFTQHTASPSQNTQNLQTRANSIISFGNFALQKCYDMNKKFRPIIGMELTEKQQCLLDNLWHIQTMPQASTFKVQVLNALCIYFQEQGQKIPEKQHKRFSHYVIFRGSKIGIFNKWETVAKYIQCPNPIYKGFYSFSEAMKTAREHFGLHSFFVEPEEVKTFSEVAKTNPEQIIKAQEEVIASLQEQLMKSGKNTQHIQFQIENSILKQKEKVFEEKIALYQQKLEQKEKETNTFIHRDFNSFKARVLDFPWQKTLKPVIDQFK